MLACAQLIAFGVLERHPALRVVFLESCGGWVPVLAGAPRRTGRVLRRLLPGHGAGPEGVLRPPVLDQLRDRRAHPARPGARSSASERIVWGSDYPHHDATFPGAVDTPRHAGAVPDGNAGAGARAEHPRSSTACRPAAPGPAGLVDDYFAAVTAQDPALSRPACSPPMRSSTSTASATSVSTPCWRTTPSARSPAPA